MSRTESAMVALGTVAPPFALLDVRSGRTVSRDDLFAPSAGTGAPRRGLLLMFVCVHCPYVKHVEDELGRIGHDYFGPNGDGPIAMAAIQSNDLTEYPQDGPEFMGEQARRCGWPFPYLLDETQAVARAYDAQCTPDFFLFDRDLRLAYRGQLDASRPRRGDYGNGLPVTGEDLRRALDGVVAGAQPDPDQRNSVGCNIKWKETAA